MTWRMMVPFTTRDLPSSSDPFLSLQRQMNRVFDDLLSRTQNGTVAALRLDVKEDDDAFHVTTDMPGMDEQEVDVTFNDGILTIRGEKKVERDEKKDTWHIIERSSGSFLRQISLPSDINADKIDAKFERGVLSIELPKQPATKAATKKIEIKSA